MSRSLLLGALLTLALACDERLTGERACTFDADCAEGERCVNEKCSATGVPDAGSLDGGLLPDAGPRDAGPADAGPPPDAGLPCTPDGLGNESSQTPLEPPGTAEEGTPVDGRFCYDDDEHFTFFGFDGDPMHAVMLYARDADVDLELFGPGASPTEGEVIGRSVHPRMEVAASRLQATGDHLLRAYVLGGAPEGGSDYTLEVRSGLPCVIDEDCVVQDHRCLMPVWTPTSAAGSPPDGERIFLGGLCAEPYEPCDPDNADSEVAEGVSQSRSDAIEGLPPVAAWSCRLDVDWFRYVMPVQGDLTLSFRNESATAGTYLLAAFDVHGNMLQAAGYAELPEGQQRALVVPYLASGAAVLVRVMQLNDDPSGLYRLTGQTFGAACAGAVDCSRDEARRFGRTECRTGNCECPVATACTPPAE